MPLTPTTLRGTGNSVGSFTRRAHVTEAMNDRVAGNVPGGMKRLRTKRSRCRPRRSPSPSLVHPSISIHLSGEFCDQAKTNEGELSGSPGSRPPGQASSPVAFPIVLQTWSVFLGSSSPAKEGPRVPAPPGALPTARAALLSAPLSFFRFAESWEAMLWRGYPRHEGAGTRARRRHRSPVPSSLPLFEVSTRLEYRRCLESGSYCLEQEGLEGPSRGYRMHETHRKLGPQWSQGRTNKGCVEGCS